VFGLGFLDLDLLTSVLSLKICSSATSSPESQESVGGLLHLHRRLDVGMCFPCAQMLFLSTGAWSSRLHPPPPSASTPGGSNWFQFSLLLRGHPWAAHVSHAPPRTAPTQPIQVLLFVFFFMYLWVFCCTPLPMFTPIFVFRSL
jgi:hypothetical protein